MSRLLLRTYATRKLVARKIVQQAAHLDPVLIRTSRVLNTSALLRVEVELGPTPHIKSRPSSLTFSALATALTVSSLLYILWDIIHDSRAAADSRFTETGLNSSDAVMTASSDTQILPGRPGNLTPEQEKKLKELWIEVYKLVQVPASNDSLAAPQTNGLAASSQNSPSPSARSSTDEPMKTPPKKHSRFGSLLGRSRGRDNAQDADSDAASTSSNSPSAAQASISDDKHGQSKEFRQALASQSPAELRENLWTFTKGDDPDSLLLRYLRARKWDIQGALVMMISTIHWRAKTMKLDSDIMHEGEYGMLKAAAGEQGERETLGKHFMAQLRMGKSFLHGCDREGRPMCFVRVRLHRGGEQTEESLERYTIYTIETARLMLKPPVDTAVIVFDMTDFSMANMDYTPVKFMIKVFEANYPESLGLVLVHRAPWIFHSIWSIIKGWLDPVVASKIQFTKTEKDLEQFIEPQHIPKEVGGKEDFDYEYIEPKNLGKDENIRLDGGSKILEELQKERQKLIDEYEQNTVEWMHGRGGQEAVGARERLRDRLYENYWQMDPYIRARSLYDRTGVIKEGGVIDFYPTSMPDLETQAKENQPPAVKVQDPVDNTAEKLANTSISEAQVSHSNKPKSAMAQALSAAGWSNSGTPRHSEDGKSVYYDAEDELD